MDTNYLTPFELCSKKDLANTFQTYLYEHNQTMLKNINQPIKEIMNRKQDREALKEAGAIIKQTFINMENKRIKTNLIKEMKKDNDLKKYVNDMENFTNEQFTVLINIFKKVNLNQ